MPTGAGPPVNVLIVGYRIDFRVGGGVLEAIVSGRSGFGRLRSLLAERHLPPRVAVIDVWQNDRFYTFAEMAARRLGCDLRRFEDHPAALAWLRSVERRGRAP